MKKTNKEIKEKRMNKKWKIVKNGKKGKKEKGKKEKKPQDFDFWFIYKKMRDNFSEFWTFAQKIGKKLNIRK